MPEHVATTHAPHPSSTLALASPANTESDDASSLGLYEHVSRPEWGVALRGASCDGRTTYQFEDGKPRKIADSHAHLMVEIDRSRDESERLHHELARQAGLSLGRRRRREAGETVFTLDQQVRLFLGEYAGGFADPRFEATYRGRGKKCVKRHRAPAIARAEELLGRKVMLALIAGYQHEDVIDRAIELLRSTSLVTAKQLAPLTSLDDAGKRRAASALCDLLYGDVVLEKAMQAWIDALASAGHGVSWPLATAIPALVMPHNHACVRTPVFSAQARWMAPGLRLAKSVPSGKLYARVNAMTRRLADELEARGACPRDLIDVHDFVWLTLRPAALARLATMPTTSLLANDEPSAETSNHADDVQAAPEAA